PRAPPAAFQCAVAAGEQAMSPTSINLLPWLNAERAEKLLSQLADRILVIDGAMGTMLQGYELDENGFRGERFAEGSEAASSIGKDLRGNNDILSLTQPDIVRAVHRAYLDA